MVIGDSPEVASQSSASPFARGDTVALRSIREFGHHGLAVGFAVAGTVVIDTDEIVVVCTMPGSEVRTRAGRGGGPNGRIVLPDEWDGSHDEREWFGGAVVRVHRWDEPWSVWRWHDGTSWTDRWYGNLESPWRRAAKGYDSQDWALDVVGEGDPGSSSWSVHLKDEDELAWMVSRGFVSENQADRVGEVGAQLAGIARRGVWPFDADWDAGLPDPAWDAVSMPRGWRDLT